MHLAANSTEWALVEHSLLAMHPIQGVHYRPVGRPHQEMGSVSQTHFEHIAKPWRLDSESFHEIPSNHSGNGFGLTIPPTSCSVKQCV